MSDYVSNFELHRQQLTSGLSAVAESMRNCAQLAETFAKIVADAEYSQETAALVAGASDLVKGKRKVALSPEEGEGTRKRKRNTKPKDPNAPKRPASSYILFQNEVRKELKEQHPNLSNSDLLSLISDQWKNMSDEQKEIYNQAMKTAKAQYSEDKKAYDNRTSEEIAAANAAVEAATALKKANTKPRGSKSKDAPATETIPVAATPATPARHVKPSPDTSDESEDEESEEEDGRTAAKSRPHHDSQSSDEDDELEPPNSKRPRAGSAQPRHWQKTKKTTH